MNGAAAEPSAAALLAAAAGGGDARAQVVQILRAAASGDARARVPAHHQLQELEGRPGFACLLLEAYADASADPQGRLLAVLMCKNVVDRRWQPRCGKGMSDEEKRHLKECILRLIALAVAGALPYLVELALVLRRICRFDFPRQWDELAHFVLGELRRLRDGASFDEGGLAVVVVLHHVLKEQSSKKLLAARRDFQQIGQVMTEPLGAVWCLFTDRLRGLLGGSGGGDPSSASAAAPSAGSAAVDDRTWRLSRYLDGCFLLLLTQGIARLHETPNGPELIVLVKDKVSLLLGMLRAHPQLVVQCPFFAKNVKSALKWWAMLLHAHPLAFARADLATVLGASAEVLRSFTAVPGQAEPHEQAQLREALLVSSLKMLTHALNTAAFRRGPQPGHQGAALEAAGLCHAQFGEFVRCFGVGGLCELGCAAALRLPAEEVRDWLSDPEDQLLGPGGATDLRQAGEHFVRALAQEPLEAPLVQHIANRMREELSQPPAANDAFDAVARRDAFLSLLTLCQPQLKPHLAFDQLLAFSSPAAALAVQASGQAPCLLLPVRLCLMLRSWCGDMPSHAVPTVLQWMQTFLQERCPKAVRLAALGPLRELIGRFSDHEAWAQSQASLIDGCLALLGELKAPEVQWRCLNLVHLFLSEEAESGRYEITERSLQRLLLLWRQPDSGEGLICLALLDVLRALVLMSCRSKQPRLPLSPPLLACALAVISDCYALHRPSGGGGSPQGAASPQGSPGGRSAESAALLAGAAEAAGSLGDQGSSSATLFDSGCVLFIGVLRTVDAAQAAALVGFFPQLLEHYSRTPGGSLHDGALDILVEYCALFVELPPGAEPLQRFYGPILQLCRGCLEGAQKDRNCELSFALLQILLAYASTPEALAQVRELLVPLLNFWVANCSPQAPPSTFRYPLHPLLQLFCTWHARHPQDFRQQFMAAASSPAHAALLLVACCRLLRPVVARASLLAAALALVEGGGGADGKFWQELLQACGDVIASASRKGPSALLVQTLQALRSSLATKLPVPARSSGELQCCMLPQELRQGLRGDGTMDEAAVVRWLLGRLAEALRRLGGGAGGCGAPGGPAAAAELQALLAGAPAEVRNALQALGL